MTAAPPQTTHVVVIDDSRRFALHTWRILTERINVGVADQPIGGEVEESWLQPGAFLSSPCGTRHVWWIEARGDVSPSLKLLEGYLPQVSAGGSVGIFFLVDYQGKESYNASKTCAQIAGLSFGKEQARIQCTGDCLWVVSAYRSGEQVGRSSRRIRAKSTQMLKDLREHLWPPSALPKKPALDQGLIQVLVTGAGFEMHDSLGSFGQPQTVHLLVWMAGEVSEEGKRRLRPRSGGSYPRVALVGGTTAGLRAVNTEGRRDDRRGRPDLDAWWNRLLEVEQRCILVEPASARQRYNDDRRRQAAALTLRALENEINLRDAYRKALLRNDWGQMQQSLDAARLPLDAWLSTNYTHFADRALQAVEPGAGSGRSWRTVSTASEAQRFEGELTHDPLGRAGGPDCRPLLKLHGDLAHVDTMAIAGWDKEISTPLSLQITSLQAMYAAARSFLLRLVRQRRGQKPALVWHIVGHALGDRLLRETMATVSLEAKASGSSVHFVLVDHHGVKKKTVADLAHALTGEVAATPLSCEFNLICTYHDAASYLARLVRNPSPGSAEVSEWLESVATRPVLGEGKTDSSGKRPTCFQLAEPASGWCWKEEKQKRKAKPLNA
ncbi:MAG: hypothetical protein ABIO70_36190 [Pseudomonadota bacterium]